MKSENKTLLIKYIVFFVIASLITLGIFSIKGFFTDSVAVNIQILSDGFSVSGLLLTLYAGLMFVSGEGIFIGLGFVFRNIVQAFVPMGRKKHEFYGQYRERKLKEIRRSSDHCAFVIGLLFLAVGVIFSVIWYTKFYNGPI